MNVVQMKERAKRPSLEGVPVHPYNDGPLMPEAELKELAADIKRYGLQEPIIYWMDNREEAKGSTGPFAIYLLDGRNRLAAMKLLGITDPNDAPSGKVVVATYRILKAVKRKGDSTDKWEADCDPEAFHMSANVYRLHRTREQRRWETKKEILRNPQASNRSIAMRLGVAAETVAAARAEIVETSNLSKETITHLTSHLPIERAKQAIRANPGASKYRIAKIANVDAHTVDRALQNGKNQSEIARATRAKQLSGKSSAFRAIVKLLPQLTPAERKQLKEML